MDAFLTKQLAKGKKLAAALVEHLRLMGAAQCRIHVGNYVVIVSVAKIAVDDANDLTPALQGTDEEKNEAIQARREQC